MGLPRRPFLYTTDQVSDLLGLSEDVLKVQYLYYHGRTLGKPKRDLLGVVQMAPCSCGREDWRVEESELLRWMRHVGFRIY